AFRGIGRLEERIGSIGFPKIGQGPGGGAANVPILVVQGLLQRIGRSGVLQNAECLQDSDKILPFSPRQGAPELGRYALADAEQRLRRVLWQWIIDQKLAQSAYHFRAAQHAQFSDKKALRGRRRLLAAQLRPEGLRQETSLISLAGASRQNDK